MPINTMCLECGIILDKSINITDANEPVPGDVSLCGHCGAVGIFTPDLSLREPTPPEKLEILKDLLSMALRRLEFSDGPSQ